MLVYPEEYFSSNLEYVDIIKFNQYNNKKNVNLLYYKT